jgi:hypothetical protein
VISVRNERGFALPLTILVITVMTMLIASANVRARTDRVIAESSGSTIDAFAVAQSGLHRYFAYYDSIKVRPPDGDSLRINVPAGFADVLAYKVYSPTDTMETELYIVRSTGILIEPTRGSDPQAQRTVAQFAQWQSAAMKVSGGVVGAFTAANNITVDSSGVLRVRGHDQCATPSASVPGLRVPLGTTAVPGDFDDLTGSAPALYTLGSGLGVANNTEIDWPTITGGQFDADHDSFRSWDASYPTMVINGDLSVNDAGGYGLLIVTGNLTLNGFFFSWRGVVLVGGQLISNTMFTTVRGITVTGLNEQLGMNPPAGQLGGGWFQDYLYYECEVRNALDALVGFVPVENAWIDNWAMY